MKQARIYLRLFLIMRTIWKNQSTLGLEPATSRSQWSNLPLVELRLLTSDPFQILRWWEPHVLFSRMISLFCHFIPDTTLFVPLFFNWWKALGRQKPVVSGSYSIKSCACNIFYNCFFLQNDMAEWANITKETRREASAICQRWVYGYLDLLFNSIYVDQHIIMYFTNLKIWSWEIRLII